MKEAQVERPVQQDGDVTTTGTVTPPQKAAEKDVKVGKAAKPAEPTFSIAQLRPSARTLFGVSQSTYDGAVSGLDHESMFTVEDMRRHIKKWLKEEY